MDVCIQPVSKSLPCPSSCSPLGIAPQYWVLNQCKLGVHREPGATPSASLLLPSPAHVTELKDFLTDLINLKCPATDAKCDHLTGADNKEVHINAVGRKAERAEEPLEKRLA